MPVLALPLARAVILRAPSVAAAPPALGTPAYIAHEVSALTQTSSKTVTKPAGTLDGHVMIAVMSLSSTTEPQTTDMEDHGFVPINTQNPGSSRLRTYYKVASSEPADYTVTWSSGAPFSALAIITFEDVDTSSPIDGTPSVNSGISTTLTGTGVTTANDNTMLVQIGHTTSGRSYSSSTLSEIIDATSSATLGVFYGLQATAGASGNKTATISSSATWACTLIALRPTNGV